jgi:hypothetical protein
LFNAITAKALQELGELAPFSTSTAVRWRRRSLLKEQSPYGRVGVDQAATIEALVST